MAYSAGKLICKVGIVDVEETVAPAAVCKCGCAVFGAELAACEKRRVSASRNIEYALRVFLGN